MYVCAAGMYCVFTRSFCKCDFVSFPGRDLVSYVCIYVHRYFVVIIALFLYVGRSVLTSFVLPSLFLCVVIALRRTFSLSLVASVFTYVCDVCLPWVYVRVRCCVCSLGMYRCVEFAIS